MQTTLFTSTMMIETANPSKYTINLNVVNVSSAPRGGTLQILQLDGTPVSTVSYNSIAPGVGTGTAAQTFQNTAAVTILYGKVTVDDNSGTIRANLVLADANGNSLVSLEAR